MKHLKEGQLLDLAEGRPLSGFEGAREHLEACRACAQALAEQRAVHGALTAGAPQVPSQRLWQSISAALDRGSQDPVFPPSSSWRQGWFGWLLAGPRLGFVFASLMVAGTGLVVILRQGSSPSPASAPALPQAAVSPAPGASLSKAKSSVKTADQPGKPAPAAASPAMTGSGKAVPAEAARELAAANESSAVGQVEDSSRLASPGQEQQDLSTPMIPAQAAGLGGPSRPYPAAAAPAPSYTHDEVAPAKLPAAEGGPAADGAWDWSDLQFAFNNRLWPKVASELLAARQKAKRPAERAFAASLLHLFSQAGQPLANFNLEGTESLGEGSLMVLQARRWDLSLAPGLAGFYGSVAVRQDGVRVEASQLVLDFANNRAVYAAPSHFTRLAGENARVVDALGKEVPDDEFDSAEGAVYDFSRHLTRLENERRHLPY
jgi:hypothetical protein